MANVRITDLSSVATADITDSDVMILDDVDAVPKVSYKITIAQLRTEFASPSSNGAESSGTSALRWSTVYGQAGDFSTTLAVGGAATLSSTLAVTGNVTVNTNKFTVTAASGNTAVAGTLAVTGATTLSAALTYGGVTLSNAVTGTGNMVLSASPTFTGTLAAAAITASGAITASLGISVTNGGLSLSAGNTLTLTGATVAGQPTWSSNQAITLSTAAQPNITSVGTLTSLTVSGDIGGANITATADLTAAASSNIAWSGRSKMYTGADGNIILSNNAATGFSLLQFGGTSSSFPALKRSSAALQARLADDSDYAAFRAGAITGSSFTGDLTGAVTGNASTATALQTARTINGTSFDGTGNITVTAAAGTLTGNTLAAGVTASSLTSVGTLTSLSVGAITSTGLLQTTLTTEQMRLRYDANTYMSVTVDSGAFVAFDVQEDGAGSSSGYNFKVEGSSVFAMSAGNGGLNPAIAFFNSAGATKQTISGSRANAEEALADLLTSLAAYGLITDSTTA